MRTQSVEYMYTSAKFIADGYVVHEDDFLCRPIGTDLVVGIIIANEDDQWVAAHGLTSTDEPCVGLYKEGEPPLYISFPSFKGFRATVVQSPSNIAVVLRKDQ